MMRDALRSFPKQWAYEPMVENAAAWPQDKTWTVVCGMGGSHLAADLLRIWKPELPVMIQTDYGLPAIVKSLGSDARVICSSYSGNTEEVLEAYDQAQAQNLPLAVIAVGGELIARAKKDRVPYVGLPNTGIQPRSATGLSFRALLKLLGEESALKESAVLMQSLENEEWKKIGEDLASQLIDRIPLVYASVRNFPLALNWKIKFNETGKIPAFCHAIPELNHNEMTGFDVVEATKKLSEQISVVLLKDAEDHPKNRQRMKVLAKLYRDRGLRVVEYDVTGKTVWEKIFGTLLVGDWAALTLGDHYGVESEQVPMVEEFKKLIRS